MVVFLTVGSITGAVLMKLPYLLSVLFTSGDLLIERFLMGVATSAFVGVPLALLAGLVFLLPLWLVLFGVNINRTRLGRTILSKGILLGALAGITVGIAFMTQFVGPSNEFSLSRVPAFLFMLALFAASGAASGYVVEKVICPDKAM